MAINPQQINIFKFCFDFLKAEKIFSNISSGFKQPLKSRLENLC